ncbi:MAG TPA: hypothetical protein VF319_17995, partial [Caldimonas sp.]
MTNPAKPIATIDKVMGSGTVGPPPMEQSAPQVSIPQFEGNCVMFSDRGFRTLFNWGSAPGRAWIDG